MAKDDFEKKADTTPRRRDVELILAEIEKEPVPERILALAMELQAALAERRRRMRNGEE